VEAACAGFRPRTPPRWSRPSGSAHSSEEASGRRLPGSGSGTSRKAGRTWARPGAGEARGLALGLPLPKPLLSSLFHPTLGDRRHAAQRQRGFPAAAGEGSGTLGRKCLTWA